MRRAVAEHGGSTMEIGSPVMATRFAAKGMFVRPSGDAPLCGEQGTNTPKVHGGPELLSDNKSDPAHSCRIFPTGNVGGPAFQPMEKLAASSIVLPIGLLAQAEKLSDSFEKVSVPAQEFARCTVDVPCVHRRQRRPPSRHRAIFLQGLASASMRTWDAMLAHTVLIVRRSPFRPAASSREPF